MIKKYRKKPVVIEAFQFTIEMAEDYCFKNIPLPFNLRIYGGWNPKTRVLGRIWIPVETLEGRMIAHIGDYVIKGIKGEIYPCKPDIFLATYDEEL
jgi:hypothetical protein